MKPKEKAEDEVDDRTRRRRRGRSSPETHNACLPQENQVRRKSRRRSQIPEGEYKGNAEETLPQKAHSSSYLVWALRPGAGLHAVWSTPPQRKHSVEAFLQHEDSRALPQAPSVESSRLLESGFDCALPYGDVFIYAWSFSVLRHDVPRFLLAQKRREETKDVFIASKMRPNFGWLQVIWVSGSFKRKEKKGAD